MQLLVSLSTVAPPPPFTCATSSNGFLSLHSGRNRCLLVCSIGLVDSLGIAAKCPRKTLSAGMSLPFFSCNLGTSASLIHGACSLATALVAGLGLSTGQFHIGDVNHAQLVVIARHRSCHKGCFHRLDLPQNRYPRPGGCAEEEILPRYLPNRRLEESSGLFGQGFMWWLNHVIYSGARHTLKPKQLYPITADMESERLANNFRVLWSQPGHNSPKLGLARLLRRPIFVPVLPRLAVMAFTLCQPLLLSRLLEYLADPGQRQDVKTGYGLIGAAALVFAGMAVMLILRPAFPKPFVNLSPPSDIRSSLLA